MPLAIAHAVTASPEPIIVMDRVSRSFGDHVVINELSLEVEPGTILGLIGPSGSGKTTTVRMLTGTLSRGAGTIRVLGEDPMRFRRVTRSRIAYMPQLFSLYEDLTAAENVGFVAAMYGIGPFRRGKLIRRALEVVGLAEARNRLARHLSGGMQRRLELACALVHQPEVLFVDEPTAGVDPMLRKAIWDEIRRLRDEGRTLLVTTQYVGEAEYCDRVALIADGELVAYDTPDELRRLVFGGEVLEVRATEPVAPEMLHGLPGLVSIWQPTARSLTVTTSDAAATTPRIVEQLRAHHVETVAVEEHQPTFDEVFEGLVERRREERRHNGDETRASGDHA